MRNALTATTIPYKLVFVVFLHFTCVAFHIIPFRCYSTPDYAHAYVWVAPVLMNPKRCEEIEPFLARVRGVTQTGRGGDPPEKRNPLRPFVFAVIDLQARRGAP